MADPAHEETDRIIKRIEREINKEYAQAEKELREKSEKFMRKFAEKDKKKMADLKAGKITQKEYDNWRMGQIAIGKRWDEMRDVMAKDLANTSEIARSIAIKHMPEVYAVNYNYGTYDAESQCRMNTSFTLYNADTVERLIKEHPRLLPIPSEKTQKEIREGKLIAWDKEKLQSAMVQGILQGDSIPNIAKRLAGVADMNRKSSIRNARTMATGVQNAGRLNAYRRAESKGIEMEKTWVATHDGRTRHWHSELDMVSVPLNESFVNDYGEIEYPGDPGADPANVYNCRCTLLGKAGKVKTFHERLKQYEKDYKMEWDKWRKDHGYEPLKSLGKALHEKAHDVKDAVDKVVAQIGVTGDSYTKAAQEEMQKLLSNSPQFIQKAWEKVRSGGFFQATTNEGTTKRHPAYYSSFFNRVHLKPRNVAKGDALSPAFQTHFHEYGHNVDCILGKLKYQIKVNDRRGYLSTEYRSKDGKTFGEIIMGEWEKKFAPKGSSEVPGVRNFLENLDTSKGGLGGFSWAGSELTNWRRLNGISRDDARYLALRDAIGAAKNDSEIEKIVRSNLDVFNRPDMAKLYEAQDKLAKKQAVEEYCKKIKSEYGLSARGDLSDMLEKYSVKVGYKDYPLGAGHGSSYALKEGNLEVEAFAEMFSAEISNNASLELIKQELPESYAVFREIVEGIL